MKNPAKGGIPLIENTRKAKTSDRTGLVCLRLDS
jgi:hypothetical protein